MTNISHLSWNLRKADELSSTLSKDNMNRLKQLKESSNTSSNLVSNVIKPLSRSRISTFSSFDPVPVRIIKDEQISRIEPRFLYFFLLLSLSHKHNYYTYIVHK